MDQTDTGAPSRTTRSPGHESSTGPDIEPADTSSSDRDERPDQDNAKPDTAKPDDAKPDDGKADDGKADENPGLVGGVTQWFTRLRERSELVDHTVRAGALFTERNSGQLAASCSYFGFLAIFPLLLLAFAILGYVFAGNPEITAKVGAVLNSSLPFISVEDIIKARGAATIIGLVGFFYAGLGWVDATRTAIRTIWRREVAPGNFFLLKFMDAGILLGLGLILGISFALSAVLSGATRWLLDLIGLADSTAGGLFLQGVGVVLGLAVNVVFFVALLSGLPRLKLPMRVVFWPAFLSAVGFTLLRTFGVAFIAHSQANPAYQAVGVAVGVMLFLYYLNQLMFFSAALTATSRHRDEVVDLGTGHAEDTEPKMAD